MSERRTGARCLSGLMPAFPCIRHAPYIRHAPRRRVSPLATPDCSLPARAGVLFFRRKVGVFLSCGLEFQVGS